MKVFSVLLFACIAGVAQTPSPLASQLPNVPDETVIVTFDDGVSMSAGEFKHIFDVLPSEQQQAVLKNKQEFIKQWALMRKLTQMAEREKLEEQSPTREKALYYRMMTLSEAEMLRANSSITVTPAEAQAYYEAHKDKYKDVTVKAIYLGFSSDPGGKPRSEDEAKALAAKIVGDLQKGGDFVKLVAQYSEEPTSKAKAGDFGTFHGSDNIPEATRTMVMALKPGEVSQPIRQPNGIYIFRAESATVKTFDQVSDEIFSQMRQARYAEWLDKTNRETKIDIKSPAYFGLPATPPAGGKQQSGQH